MKLVHVAPFAPGRCGLYETVRDLVLGERRLGHEAILVDSGVIGEGPHYGQSDGELTSCPPSAAHDADILITHTSPSSEVVAISKNAPVLHVIHGRPESSFRLSVKGGDSPVYDIYASWAKDGKVARWLTLWPEHLPYWQAIIPADKLFSTTAPPCDLSRWKKDGLKHTWSVSGEKNILVADTWRDDSDPYHILHGLMLAAEKRPGIKIHIYAMQTPLGPWEHILRKLRVIGALGETCGMMRNIDQRYRAADLVVTPHRIATRIVREAAACGSTVLTGEAYANWGSYGCNPLDPYDVADQTLLALENPNVPDVSKYDSVKIAQELIDHAKAVI